MDDDLGLKMKASSWYRLQMTYPDVFGLCSFNVTEDNIELANTLLVDFPESNPTKSEITKLLDETAEFFLSRRDIETEAGFEWRIYYIPTHCNISNIKTRAMREGVL